MTDQELLARAVAFDVGPEPFINGTQNYKQDGKYWWVARDCGEPKEVEYRHHCQVRFTGSKWVIVRDSQSLMSKSAQWEYASLPSEQTDDFHKRTRFDNARDAMIFFERRRRIMQDAYDRLKESHSGAALWEEIEKVLTKEFAQAINLF